MFTGIVQDIGEIASIDKQGDWTIAIKTRKFPLDKTAIGASISCSGVCLTVIEKAAAQFKVRVSMETLSKTTAVHWREGGKINLEPALKMGDELGGHLLSGHVDGLARVTDKSVSGDSIIYIFDVPRAFAKFIAPKGSVAIDGVSLTINAVDDTRFGINIIPHTQKETTLASLNQGDEANFEIDMIARYVERMLGK
ncbi:MAG TPA: riboflavin synthase [Alphaproteobacteria bacterium]|nr:riboflavin synthase [Alphaproteobacteria bacterium]